MSTACVFLLWLSSPLHWNNLRGDSGLPLGNQYQGEELTVALYEIAHVEVLSQLLRLLLTPEYLGTSL